MNTSDFIFRILIPDSYRVERSSDQVVNPINKQALNKWVGSIPQDVLDELDTIAPMLKILGYT